jgi:circadian clock protein KaiB
MSGSRTTSKERTLRLRLYVVGESPNSVAALRHLRALLAAYPSRKVDLEILDLIKHPEWGVRDGVLVTPLMIKLAPAPERRIFGTLKDTDVLVSVLGLAEAVRE